MPSFYQNVFGWMDYENYYNDAVNEYNDGLFVEVGSFQGRSMCYLAELVKEKEKNITLVSVDLFPTKDELQLFRDNGAGQGEECKIIESLPKSLLDTFVENIQKAGIGDIVIPIKSDSKKASKLFNYSSNIRFCFIDANHEYSGVLADLECWWPLVQHGGTMAGHDWGTSGVNRAVKEFFGRMKLEIEVSVSSWRVRKPAN